MLQIPYISNGTPAFVIDVARSVGLQLYAPHERINQMRTLSARLELPGARHGIESESDPSRCWGAALRDLSRGIESPMLYHSGPENR